MKKRISANTFTPLYDPLEDRIRFVINYNDYENRVDFMLTRRFILQLIPSIEEFIQKHYTDASKETTELTLNYDNGTSKENNSTTTTQTDSVDLELYRRQEELLQEVNLSFNARTKQTTVIFQSKEFEVVAVFDVTLIRQVFSILKGAIPYVEWGVGYRF